MDERFLNTNEYIKTKPLAAACFGAGQELDEYYAKDVFDNRIAAVEDDGEIISMVQLRRMIAVYADRSVPVWYILYVCTAPNRQRCGYMKKLMSFVLDTLRREKEQFAFLVPVDSSVYTELGFVHKWKFNNDEADMLYADDGLTECFACELCGEPFIPPLRIEKAACLDDLHFISFDEDAVYNYFDLFYIRPNKTFYSIPLDSFNYRNELDVRYCVADNRCLFMMAVDSKGLPYAPIPYCAENELAHYFRLLERYFNEVLHAPLRIFETDKDGTNALAEFGVLDNYEVTEQPEFFDYIYSGDDLRTLSGRKFSKKRNHINNFEKNYGGRWEYRTLGYDDRAEIGDFLEKWNEAKTVDKIQVIYDVYDTEETLEIEKNALIETLGSRKIMSKVKAGGIYIDSKLCAFSLGVYNPLEKMAVIEVEKAFSEYDGLYQLISREFLIHEFPQAELVNREDDVGLPGLRKSKMSYNPIILEKRYTILQSKK